MNFYQAARIGAIALLSSLAACQTTPQGPSASGKADTDAIAARRQQVIKMSQHALEMLFAENSKVKDEIGAAAGYAVFDLSSVNAVIVYGARGKGVIFDNMTGGATFMKTARVGTGPGIGYQKLFQVIVFQNESALSQFKLGDKGGGDFNASATAGDSNKQISFNPNIKVYEIRDKGFAVQANWGGTAYLVDPDLN